MSYFWGFGNIYNWKSRKVRDSENLSDRLRKKCRFFSCSLMNFD